MIIIQIIYKMFETKIIIKQMIYKTVTNGYKVYVNG